MSDTPRMYTEQDLIDAFRAGAWMAMTEFDEFALAIDDIAGEYVKVPLVQAFRRITVTIVSPMIATEVYDFSQKVIESTNDEVQQLQTLITQLQAKYRE